jgi:Subtilisin inhibitor-like
MSAGAGVVVMRAIAGVLVSAVLAVPSSAAVAGGGRTSLTLSYEADAGYAVAVTLRCDPPGGGHPKAAEACRALANVDGDPSYLRPAQRYCMLIYAPVTARITGRWKGARVDWSRRFGNTCEMTRATGVLFEF